MSKDKSIAEWSKQVANEVWDKTRPFVESNLSSSSFSGYDWLQDSTVNKGL